MIVFDLRCPREHVFEAWFGSSAAFEDQRAQGLLICPVCGDTDIAKALMTPNVAAKGNSLRAADERPSGPPAGPMPTPEAVKQAMQQIAALQAKALENSQWVGAAFPDKARAMHLGEIDAAPIHGQTTLDEARALVEEGVPIAALPLPVLPPEALN